MAQSSDPATILRERVNGATLDQLASRHGLSGRPQALRVVRRATDQAIDELEAALRDACSEPDGVLLYAVPTVNSDEQDVALAWLRFSLGQLAERGINVRVYPRETINGLVLGLEIDD